MGWYKIKLAGIVNSFFVTILFLLPATILAQEDRVGNWLMYFGANRISDKFSIHTELQFRNHAVIPNNTEQWLARTGLNYHFSSKAFATVGYAFVPSYEFDSEQKAPESIEHRIWQQLILNNNLGRVKFEHRYRIEQRWVDGNYKNRLRYRLMLFVPLNKPVIEKGTIFLGLYDEIFVNTKEVFFDRNRLYGALGYQISKSLSVQVGMLYQQLSSFGKWYLQSAIIYNPDFRKPQK